MVVSGLLLLTCISLFILGTVVVVSGLLLLVFHCLFQGTIVVVSGLQLLVFHCLFQGPSWSSLVYCYLYFTVYFRDRRGRLWSNMLLVFHCLFQGPSWSSLVYSYLYFTVYFRGPSWSSLVYCYLYFTVYFRGRRGRLWSTVTCISLFILGTIVIVAGLLLLVFHCLFQGPSWSSLVYCYLYFTVYFRPIVVVSGLLLLVFHCLFQDRRGRLWSTVTCISLFILGTIVIVSGLLLLVFHCLFYGPSWSSLVYCYLYFTVYFRDRRGRLWSTVTCISLFILETVVVVSGLLLLVFHCLFQGPS